MRLPRWWGGVPAGLIAALWLLRAALDVAPLDQLARGGADARDPPGATVYRGSIAVTRGGPVILGFESTQPARLTFAGRELRGQGLVKERIVVPHGATALRFAVPAGARARLVWSPVGRRGDPEYVPASSLSPAPPERATFDGPGATPRDGAIALAILAVLVATACLLARRRLARVDRATWIAMGAVLVGALVVRGLGLGDQGQTWDEDVNWAAGKNYVSNVFAFDFSPASWRWNYEHPPVMKLLAGIGGHLADGYGPARALSALWVALGCMFLVPIGARLYTRPVGILAGVIAALLPPLVAHGQVVGHEAPTVLWWTLGILLALGVHDEVDGASPAPRRILLRVIAVGAVIGIAVASRFVNGLLGPLGLLIVVVQAPPAARLRGFITAAIAMPLSAVFTFWALWPRLWLHPIAALQQSLAKLDSLHGAEPFLGAMTNQPGPHYFVVYLAATLPVGLGLGVVAWAVEAARTRGRAALVMLAWLAIPLVITASPVRQDGLRYVMPCVLALALMAAAGLVGLAALVATRVARVARASVPGISALVGLYLAITLARVHPYYLDYFAEPVGGPGAVAERRLFETAWWGEGLDRALAYVNTHAAPGAKVLRCIEPAHLAWFREDLWTAPRDAAAADWIVVYAPHRTACAIPPAFRLAYENRVAGVVYARVFAR